MAEWGDKLTSIVFLAIGIYLVACGFGLFGKEHDAARTSDRDRQRYRRIEKFIGLGFVLFGIGSLILR